MEDSYKSYQPVDIEEIGQAETGNSSTRSHKLRQALTEKAVWTEGAVLTIGILLTGRARVFNVDLELLSRNCELTVYFVLLYCFFI